MKINILILTMFFGFCILSGCSSDDDNTVSQKEESLNGTWDLKNLSGGFPGLDESYAPGEITWTFDTQNETIIIENNNSASTAFIFVSGTYNYSVITENNQKYLNINGDEYGGLTISPDSLIIDQDQISYGVGADGFILSFEK